MGASATQVSNSCLQGCWHPRLGWIFLGAGGSFIPARGGVLRPTLALDPQGWVGLTDWQEACSHCHGWLGSSLQEPRPFLASWSGLNSHFGFRRGGGWVLEGLFGTSIPCRLLVSTQVHPSAFTSDTDTLTLIHSLGSTHPDRHLHRHTHLRTQYSSRQHTAYTPRPERLPPPA